VICCNKFCEGQKYLAITRHIYQNMIHTVGVAAWKKLHANQQAIIREESTPAGDQMRKPIGEQESEQIVDVEAAGMQLARPDLAAFHALMGPPMRGSPPTRAPTT
jgi:TRAP-type C4-dicarboxylate transport system substrate-binding protein